MKLMNALKNSAVSINRKALLPYKCLLDSQNRGDHPQSIHFYWTGVKFSLIIQISKFLYYGPILLIGHMILPFSMKVVKCMLSSIVILLLFKSWKTQLIQQTLQKISVPK